MPALRILGPARPPYRDPFTEPGPIAEAVGAAERVRAVADALERALNHATAAGLQIRVRVTEPLGEAVGWRVEVEGAGW